MARGRPRKAYPHLAAAGPDETGSQWLKRYRSRFPDEWDRMLRTLRRSGGAKTWSDATLRKKASRDVGMFASSDNILSDGDEPVYLHDLAHLMNLYPGINGAQKLQPMNRDGAYIDPAALRQPEHRIGRQLSAQFRRHLSAGEFHDEERAFVTDEREYLEALEHKSSWLEVLFEELYRLWQNGRVIYVSFVPISDGLNRENTNEVVMNQ